VKIDWKKIGIKQLAALISVKLREHEIDAILVGGACVSIYTKNRYLSFDLDFVTHATLKEVALFSDRFKRNVHAIHPFTVLFIELLLHRLL
jgi:hypothetical protein